MKVYSLVLFVLVGAISGCSAHYGPAGIAGGYEDRQLTATTFAVRLNGSPFTGGFTDERALEGQWVRRARELCGSSDFYKEIIVYKSQNTSETSSVSGFAYCNNKIMDTRKQSSDENFKQYLLVPYNVFEYKELTPLWDMLIGDDYTDLQDEVDNLVATVDERDAATLLESLSRINPLAEEHLSKWIEEYPGSSLAYYVRADYYHSYAWFLRGNRMWKDVTQKQRNGFSRYMKLAIADVKKSLELNPGLCIAHNLKLNIYTTRSEGRGETFEKLYSDAKENCPDSMGIRKAYLRNALPRWHGSMNRMHTFVDAETAEDEKYSVLEALILHEEGDSFLTKNKVDRALEKYTAALDLMQIPLTLNSKASILVSKKQYVEALENYKMSVEYAPYYLPTYEGVLSVLVKQGDLLGALSVITLMTELNNQEPLYFEQQGDLFYLMRRYDDALVSYRKAAILSSDKPVHRHKIKMTRFQIEVRSADESAEIKGEAI